MSKPKKVDVVNEAIQKVTEVVDELVHPKNMSRDEYKDFLGTLASDMRMRLETAEQEDKEEEG